MINLKKLLAMCLAPLILASSFGLGCTRHPSPEELSKLGETKKAAKAAERRFQEKKEQKKALEKKLAEKKTKLQRLEKRRDITKRNKEKATTKEGR